MSESLVEIVAVIFFGLYDSPSTTCLLNHQAFNEGASLFRVGKRLENNLGCRSEYVWIVG